MAVKTLNVNEDILGANDMLAENLRGRFEASKVFVMNLMSSPGAGKTSVILKIIEALSGKHKIGVIEGDIASDVDARKIQKTNVDVVQINTRGACHLDANMILSATDSLGLEGKQLLIIENVGNLVCPANYDLGEALKVVVASPTEGDDKPLKYPEMFRNAAVLIVNKIDLLPYLDCDIEALKYNARQINPKLIIFETSCTTKAGIAEWCNWIIKQLPTVE